MNAKNISFSLILTLFSIFLTVACANAASDNLNTSDTVAGEDNPVEIDESTPTTEEDETVETSQISENTQSTVVKTTQKKEASYGRKETIYISTYGANGKVWGHVTMNGNTGRGTIHDDDENSYSITVTRHGGELYGTDQNGRQYVFKM